MQVTRQFSVLSGYTLVISWDFIVVKWDFGVIGWDFVWQFHGMSWTLVMV